MFVKICVLLALFAVLHLFILLMVSNMLSLVFGVAIEFSERLTYFGLATNLISYLTKLMHQDLKTAAKNVNYWTGVTTLMPLLGGFLADAYTGRFNMVMFSSLIYLMVIPPSFFLEI